MDTGGFDPIEIVEVDLNPIELENIQSFVEDEYKAIAEDLGIEWKDSYEESALEVAKNIMREMDRVKWDLISQVGLSDLPWDK